MYKVEITKELLENLKKRCRAEDKRAMDGEWITAGICSASELYALIEAVERAIDCSLLNYHTDSKADHEENNNVRPKQRKK